MVEGARKKVGLRVEAAHRLHQMNDGHRHSYNSPVGVHPMARICIFCKHSEADIRRARNRKNKLKPERPLSEVDKFIHNEYMKFGSSKENSATAYAIIYQDQKMDRLMVSRTHQGGCFGGISHSLDAAKRRGKLIALIIASGSPTQERWSWRGDPHMQEYLDWLINHSPYRYAFLDKDPAAVLRHGSRMNLRMSMKYLVSAGVGLRYIMEKPYVVENWCRLRSTIGPTLALFFAQIHMMDGAGSHLQKYFTKKERKYNTANKHWNSGHCIFSSDLSLTGLRRYLSTDLSKELLLPSAHEDSEYRGRMRTWDDGNHFKMEDVDVVFTNQGRIKKVKVPWSISPVERLMLDITTLPELGKQFVTENKLEEFVNEDLAKESRHRSR